MIAKKKKAIVFGAGGFIGSHLVKFLKKKNYWIRAVDLKKPEFSDSPADEFLIGDLRNKAFTEKIFDMHFDEAYQLAADMGGAGYIFTGKNDFDIMCNSLQINLNILTSLVAKKAVKKIFFSSSACIYPQQNQLSLKHPICKESSAYPADPDSEYGWEKLTSERMYLAAMRNKGIEVKIARFHNIFGPEGTWRGGKEKAPAAICRKVAEAKNSGIVEVWGDGKQTRSFLFIDECIEGIYKLMNKKNFAGPVNIGSEEMVSINQLVRIVASIAKKKLSIQHLDGPLGVRGRNSDNTLIKSELDWAPNKSLKFGLEKTYRWIEKEINANKKNKIP